MCRLCGRVVKCIFDSMPSRTLRLQTASPRVFTSTSTFTSSASTLSTLLARSFSALSVSPSPRPTLRTQQPSSIPSFAATTTTTSTATTTTTSTATSTIQRLQHAFSTSATLQGYRRRMDTFSPSRRVQKRRHGYLARLKTKAGRNILKRRQLKGKRFLSW